MNRIIGILLVLWILAGGGACTWRSSHPEERQMIFHGVSIQRDVRSAPRRMMITLVRVDLRTEGIHFLVTPGDMQTQYPLKAMTTSQFAKRHGVQVAVNGDGFSPWHANTILDYYPHCGDGIEPTGFAASNGQIYSQDTDEEPTLYFSPTGQVQFFTPPRKIMHAISGTDMLVRSGQIVAPPGGTAEPRTALGLTRSGKELLLVVVDGRQPGYSEGATLAELAQIMLDYGSANAMNLDGGGSSTLVVQEDNGSYRVVNSPINHDIPGNERCVGNHIGVYAGRAGDDEKLPGDGRPLEKEKGEKKQP